MGMQVGFLYDPGFLEHQTPQWHPETPQRLTAILQGLKDSGLWQELKHPRVREATEEELLAVHSPGHLGHMAQARGYVDADTYVSQGSWQAALLAAGAVCRALELIKEGSLQRAFCAVRPPGHHAERERAMGFCLLNNVAVGARAAQALGYQKVFIIDFDVHHGNGTQHIFEEDPTVFYFSTHQWPHYPGTGASEERGRGPGEGYTYNVPLQAGSGDREYLQVYGEALPRLMEEFRPQAVLVSAGYDLRVEDPLAAMRVTEAGLKGIVQSILAASGKLPVVFALEGGYDLQALSSSVLSTVELLCQSL
jgi:acetoin utilization deacetylase AcuC-like enzyme